MNYISLTELIWVLYDTYSCELDLPSLTLNKRGFKEASSKRWAIEEYGNYICKCVSNPEHIQIDNLLRLTMKFQREMKRLSKLETDGHNAFSVAYDMVTNIKDLIMAMK